MIWFQFKIFFFSFRLCWDQEEKGSHEQTIQFHHGKRASTLHPIVKIRGTEIFSKKEGRLRLDGIKK